MKNIQRPIIWVMIVSLLIWALAFITTFTYLSLSGY